MSVRIKICGITRLEDAKVAANLGVDAIGFIFFRKSPRYIEPEDACRIIRQLPPFISRVGVFVDETIESISSIAQMANIDTIQLHGSQSPEFCSSLPLPVIKAFSIKGDSDIFSLTEYQTAGLLLDTWHEKMHGGTGVPFDWAIARRASDQFKHVILAGGLGPSNLEEALDAVHPFGVDINSGVEIMPGVKNPHKMRDAVRIIKNWKSV